MSAEWTAARLDALPEWTVVTWTEGTYPRAGVCIDHVIRGLADATYTAVTLIEDADPGSIRVVSVPIDALLSDEALLAAAKAEVAEVWDHEGDTWNLGDDEYRDMQLGIATLGLRAAIAHVTGEAL